MEKKQKKGRKGRVYKRLVVLDLLAILVMIPNALAVNELIANDDNKDLLEFDEDYLNDIMDGIYDDDDFEDIGKKDFIERSNEFYNEIQKNKNEAKVVSKPKCIDIEQIVYDSEEKELKICMVEEIKDELFSGTFWTAKTSYIFIIYDKEGIYYKVGSEDDYGEIEIDERDMIFDDITSKINEEEYFKAIIIAESEDDDKYVVETFYNHEARDTMLLWLLIFIIIAIILVAIVILIVHYRK